MLSKTLKHANPNQQKIRKLLQQRDILPSYSKRHCIALTSSINDAKKLMVGTKVLLRYIEKNLLLPINLVAALQLQL